MKLTETDFEALLNKDGIFIDVKGVFRDKFKKLEYWSL